MDRAKQRVKTRSRIGARVRRKLSGTAERPRIAVFRSLKHIYVQAIDDREGRTIASASSLDKEIAADVKGSNVDSAKAVGSLIAERIKAHGIESAVFDRGGYPYHGKIKALADAAREKGLKF